MVSGAQFEDTEAGRVAKGDGWYVVNARDTRWYHAEGRPAICDFEGEAQFSQLGINLQVMGPGQPMAMYHWEADQEDFLVIAGEGLLIIEGEERPLRQWDFVHCPPKTNHVIIGAGDKGCVVIAVGARVDSVDNPDWGGYPVNETALKHGAGVETETSNPEEAYADVRPRREPTRFKPEFLEQLFRG
jgi:uncharacterized cupin superfamily protein